MQIAVMSRLKEWGRAEANRIKAAAYKELDPRNPVKTRLVSAWGLLIVGVLLVVMVAIFIMTLHHRSYDE